MLYFLTFAVLATSLISGVLSMAGGMILMGIFGLFLSVPAAMVLHGIAQTASNGSRIWLYRRYIRWSVLVPYSAAALLVLGVFVAVKFIPDKGLLFLMIGSFPFLALVLPRSINLDMEKKPVSFLCGLLVTLAQMLAGAAGPVLDIFYIKSSLSRHEILGTKAITQTLGHIIKLCYYAFFLAAIDLELPHWIYAAVILAALLGNWLGKLVIERIDDDLFRRVGRYVIMVIGALYVVRGLNEYLSAC